MQARLLFAILLVVSARTSSASPSADLQMTRYSERGVLVSTDHVESGLAKAPTDSFWVYGGPGTDEGKFQSGSVPDAQGWIGADLTDVLASWQISDFNAEGLHSNGPGNLAAWCGQTAEQQPDWLTAPGYGNNWFEALTFEKVVTDPSQGQTVDLDFYFHHDTEPQYDFFLVQYDSAGTWHSVYEVWGSNKDGEGVFHAPGLRYSEEIDVMPIVYTGNDYGVGDAIRVRLLVTSFGGADDADGRWPSSGAVQVDDITLTCSEGTYFDDFENGWGNWWPDKSPFAGDFFSVYTRSADIDPCLDNATPLAGFVDYGQVVGNSASAEAIPGYPVSTGGTQSGNWAYGIAGNWVVSYEGGLSGGQVGLENAMVSPEITWELPGTADDGPDVVGAILRFDIWEHLPLLNGLFHTWHVRSTSPITPWSNRNFVYYGGGTPHWISRTLNVTDLLPTGVEQVQIRLLVVDLANAFGFPGRDATVSPLFDNISLQKYRVGGPALSVAATDLANDGFPDSGGLDASTVGARDALDIRFDMAKDITRSLSALVPGDSVVVDAVSRVPGASLSDFRMVWVLDKNPLFEDGIRQAPSSAWDENVSTANPLRWTGEVVARASFAPDGSPVPNRFFFDLPDVDFLYPGDRLRYYFQATDSDARVSTLPDDTTGFLSGQGFDRNFQVSGLPSLKSLQGEQPTKLIIHDAGRGNGEDEVHLALRQLGFTQGVDFDIYTVQAATQFASNGIGSTAGHGAHASQLRGYDTVCYFAEDVYSGLLSDGSDNGSNDKGDDLAVLTAWHELPGPRHAVYFGDSIGTSLELTEGAGDIYLQNVMGVEVTDDDVSDDIGDQSAPVVVRLNPAFSQGFVAYGGCHDVYASISPAFINPSQFDNIRPLSSASRGHGFEVASAPGAAHADIAASVIHERIDGLGDRKVDVTFPFGFQFVHDRTDVAGTGVSARARLLGEVFDFFGVDGGGEPTASPPNLAAEMLVHPSPFNPRTTIRLSLPTGGVVRLEIYDLRGRRVHVLHNGLLESGKSSWVWDGRDAKGASVASGVYVILAEGPGFDLKKKVSVLK